MKSSTFTERNNKLRSEVTQFFKKHCPAFSYKGRAIHVGHWETSTVTGEELIAYLNAKAFKPSFDMLDKKLSLIHI